MADTGSSRSRCPQMGESVTEGMVLEWHKSEGEFVEEGETVVEVSTDKVDAEVPAPASGTITKMLAQPDDTVTVGQVLAQLDPNGTASGNGAGAEESAETEAPPGLTPGGTGEGDADLGEDDVEAESSTPGKEDVPAQDGTGREARTPARTSISMPEMGESVTEGTVLEWHKAEGDSVAEGETVIEVSTDKVDAEVPSPASGTITKLLVSPTTSSRSARPSPRWRPGAATSAAARPGGRRRLMRLPLNAPAPPARSDDAAPPPSRGGSPPTAGIDRSARSRAPARAARSSKADVLAAATGNGAAPAAATAAAGRGEAAARPRGDARQGDGREPLDPDGDLVPDACRSTRSTPSARRSTACSRSAG